MPIYPEVCFQHQNFEGEKILKSFLKRHQKNEAYKNAPCQSHLRCTFYLNVEGYVDSISAFNYGQYVSEPKVTFFNEIEHEIASQIKNYRFRNQVVYENDTTNMESFTLFLNYECGKSWKINESPLNIKNSGSMIKPQRLNSGKSKFYLRWVC